jgi:hypothetical protein
LFFLAFFFWQFKKEECGGDEQGFKFNFSFDGTGV